MTDMFTRFMPSLDAIIKFHQDNLEAFVHAQTVFAKGVQELSKEWVAQTQAQIEAAASAGKSALSATTLQEVVQLHVDGAQGTYDKLVASSTKLGKLSAQVTTEALAPLQARATVAAETFMKPLAA